MKPIVIAGMAIFFVTHALTGIGAEAGDPERKVRDLREKAAEQIKIPASSELPELPDNITVLTHSIITIDNVSLRLNVRAQAKVCQDLARRALTLELAHGGELRIERGELDTYGRVHASVTNDEGHDVAQLVNERVAKQPSC